MKTFKEQRWMIIVYGIVLFAVGLVDFILSIVDLGSAIKVVSYTIASGLFTIGLLHIVTNLIKDTKSFFKGALIMGCIAIALGVLFVAEPKILGTYLIYFAASFVTALSAIFVFKGALGIRFHYKKSWIVWYFIFASIGITLGVIGFVYGKSETVSQIIYIIMGALAIVVGVGLIVYGIKTISKKDD